MRNSEFMTRALEKGFVPGARFKDLVKGKEFIVADDPFKSLMEAPDAWTSVHMYIDVAPNPAGRKKARIYTYNNWAEIITEPKKTKPEPRFKVGDTVTYKNREDCTHANGITISYYHGGNEQGGYKGKILEYYDYVPERGCYKMSVRSRTGGAYSMLESEFEEYDIPQESILDKWLRETKAMNLSLSALRNYIGASSTCPFDEVYEKLRGGNTTDKAQILYDEWNPKQQPDLSKYQHLVGKTVPEKVINDWSSKEGNFTNGVFDKWTAMSGFYRDRRILNIDYVKGKPAIKLDRTSADVRIAAEGFEEFWKSQESKSTPEDDLLAEALSRYPVGTKIKSALSGKSGTVAGDPRYGYEDVFVPVEGDELCVYYAYNNKWAEIIQEEKPVINLPQKFKIWIGNNPDLSRRVQERLFELGHKWGLNERWVMYTDSYALFSDNLTLSFLGNDRKWFDENTNVEITPADLGIYESANIRILDSFCYPVNPSPQPDNTPVTLPVKTPAALGQPQVSHQSPVVLTKKKQVTKIIILNP
jgi:hypothetical protein